MEIKQECILEKSKQKKFVFKDKGESRKLTLNNEDEVESTKILIDNCVIKGDNRKCDFLHLAKDIEIYIELKGQKVRDALEQIEGTLKLISVDSKRKIKRGYVICSSSPFNTTEVQKFQEYFKSKYNLKLVIRSTQYTDKY